jgi:hypothetical protein
MAHLKNKVMTKMEHKALKQKAAAKKAAKAAGKPAKVSGKAKTLGQVLDEANVSEPIREMVQDRLQELENANGLLKTQNKQKWRLEKRMLGLLAQRR